MRRSSPGSSPSHRIAGLSPRSARCRSRQLYATFTRAPSNQRMPTSPPKVQSATRSHFRNQWTCSFAMSAQNPSGSSIERRYMAW